MESSSTPGNYAGWLKRNAILVGICGHWCWLVVRLPLPARVEDQPRSV